MTARDTGSLARLRPPGRARLTAGAAVVIVVAALAVAVLLSAVTAAGSAPRPIPSATPSREGAVTVASGFAPNAEASTLVHVLGQVRLPGLYELSGDARVMDAIAAAGGLGESADPAGVNLARRVVDGEQIVVPAVGESLPVTSPSGSATGVGGVISLSAATVEQLDSLPRIGPTIAQRIVDWREAGGRFTAVDDLLEVDGVGVKTVEALRDLVVP